MFSDVELMFNVTELKFNVVEYKFNAAKIQNIIGKSKKNSLKIITFLFEYETQCT